jgi:hypothetical protein
MLSDYRLDDRGSISGKGFLGSEAHPALYPMGYREYISRG